MPLVNPRIVVSSTIGVVIQLALTILAWGDWSSFFAHPARTWLVIGSFLLLLSRMADEEKFLEAHFGSAYQTYRQKTKRLVPLIY